ncbi:hypothetical protein DCS_06404 [Drechmeria coniospora]|uniref:Uncharacterized protein n=1 Tax=Drechmeria coniospora TaxID=98403 RepID=A0A151GBE6_DRECN|nr:hypothetical protein DCS_06404 [Drechmeria coniospora]KYK54446.1 hypothetical protein DCS_06404 [Drechmeria coniospora]
MEHMSLPTQVSLKVGRGDNREPKANLDRLILPLDDLPAAAIFSILHRRRAPNVRTQPSASTTIPFLQRRKPSRRRCRAKNTKFPPQAPPRPQVPPAVPLVPVTTSTTPPLGPSCRTSAETAAGASLSARTPSWRAPIAQAGCSTRSAPRGELAVALFSASPPLLVASSAEQPTQASQGDDKSLTSPMQDGPVRGEVMVEQPVDVGLGVVSMTKINQSFSSLEFGHGARQTPVM